MRWLSDYIGSPLTTILFLAVIFYLWASFAQHDHLLNAHQTWVSFNRFMNGCTR
jgi:hypothetical protein